MIQKAFGAVACCGTLLGTAGVADAVTIGCSVHEYPVDIQSCRGYRVGSGSAWIEHGFQQDTLYVDLTSGDNSGAIVVDAYDQITAGVTDYSVDSNPVSVSFSDDPAGTKGVYLFVVNNGSSSAGDITYEGTVPYRSWVDLNSNGSNSLEGDFYFDLGIGTPGEEYVFGMFTYGDTVGHGYAPGYGYVWNDNFGGGVQTWIYGSTIPSFMVGVVQPDD